MLSPPLRHAARADGLRVAAGVDVEHDVTAGTADEAVAGGGAQRAAARQPHQDADALAGAVVHDVVQDGGVVAPHPHRRRTGVGEAGEAVAGDGRVAGIDGDQGVALSVRGHRAAAVVGGADAACGAGEGVASDSKSSSAADDQQLARHIGQSELRAKTGTGRRAAGEGLPSEKVLVDHDVARTGAELAGHAAVAIRHELVAAQCDVGDAK